MTIYLIGFVAMALIITAWASLKIEASDVTALDVATCALMCALWPVTVAVFFYTFVKEMRKA